MPASSQSQSPRSPDVTTLLQAGGAGDPRAFDAILPAALGGSSATMKGEWTSARAWLRRELEP